MAVLRKRINAVLRDLWSEEREQDVAEYAVVLAVVRSG